MPVNLIGDIKARRALLCAAVEEARFAHRTSQEELTSLISELSGTEVAPGIVLRLNLVVTDHYITLQGYLRALRALYMPDP
jgi:hypothetical protein